MLQASRHLGEHGKVLLAQILHLSWEKWEARKEHKGTRNAFPKGVCTQCPEAGPPEVNGVSCRSWQHYLATAGCVATCWLAARQCAVLKQRKGWQDGYVDTFLVVPSVCPATPEKTTKVLHHAAFASVVLCTAWESPLTEHCWTCFSSRRTRCGVKTSKSNGSMQELMSSRIWATFLDSSVWNIKNPQNGITILWELPWSNYLLEARKAIITRPACIRYASRSKNATRK